MNFSFYVIYQYYKSTSESLLIYRFCIYLKRPFLKHPTSKKSFKNALLCALVNQNIEPAIRESVLL